jgi:thioredoxin-dependent peroxiredoxin
VHEKSRPKKGKKHMIQEGDSAPDIKLALDDGKAVSLGDLKGKAVVVYFYPKDDTPGCTTEAKDFSCLVDDFKKAGAEIVGISPDNTKSHLKFREKHGLAVKLASDEDTTIAQAFGSWVEKSMYGKKYMGVDRSTFLIDKGGKVARVWRKVKVPSHAEEVLAAVKALKGKK